MLDRDRETAAEPILVEPVFGPRAGVADPPCVLNGREFGLCVDGRRSVERVLVDPLALDGVLGRGVDRVHGDEDVLVLGGWEVL